MRSRSLVVVALLASLVTSLALAEGPKKKIGLVFDVGGLGDKSFNDAPTGGSRRPRRTSPSRRNTRSPARATRARGEMQRFAREEVRPRLRDRLHVHRRHHDAWRASSRRSHWACVDYSLKAGEKLPENLLALKFKEQEGSYLVGALAALLSKTKKVGFVGGMSIPLIKKFEAGYTAGARSGSRTRSRSWPPTPAAPATAFKNPTKGKELALAQLDQGVDMIFHASGSTGLGVFEACKERASSRSASTRTSTTEDARGRSSRAW